MPAKVPPPDRGGFLQDLPGGSGVWSQSLRFAGGSA